MANGSIVMVHSLSRKQKTSVDGLSRMGKQD